MAINTSLLIAAPMLQDYLVDNATGLPLANGTITMFHDNSRTTLKNWYYQSGSPGAYTYITLPNPLTLSGVGTIQDNNGNDTIPFYYPYSELDNSMPDPYYVVVVNSNGQQQFTRQNFPFVASSGTPATSNLTLRNYVVNNEFWRNTGTFNATNFEQAIISLSQHDGYLTLPTGSSATQNTYYSDIQFLKNATGAVDLISFLKLPLGTTFMNDIAPEYYLNIECTGTGGETQKLVQYPIALHVQNLQQQSAVATFWARCNSGNPNVSLSLFQFLGTGVSSSTPGVLRSFVLSPNWVKYNAVFAFPSVANLTLGNGADDAWFLQFNYPTGSTFNIDVAKPSVYLGTQFPSNDFVTYDMINTVISSPRTGQVIVSLSNPLYGWLAMNDGTIGNPSSSATYVGSQVWPLYNFIWNTFVTHQSFAPMFNSSSVQIPYGTSGASAIADFNANNSLRLTQAAGRLLANIGTSGLNTTTPITGSSNIGGWILGQATGYEQHIQQPSELAPHAHTVTIPTNIVGTPGGAGSIYESANAATLNVVVATSTTGANINTNLQNPVTYMNFFIKL